MKNVCNLISSITTAFDSCKIKGYVVMGVQVFRKKWMVLEFLRAGLNTQPNVTLFSAHWDFKTQSGESRTPRSSWRIQMCAILTSESFASPARALVYLCLFRSLLDQPTI